MSDLKPCRWCGKSALLTLMMRGGAYVDCLNKGCPGNAMPVSPTVEAAKAAWNRREPPQGGGR